MALPAYTTVGERMAFYGVRVFVGLVLLFLMAPILAIMPLSFNSETFFSYPMPGFSLKWYVGEQGFLTNERWQSALRLSVILAIATTCCATFLGTLAALGLSRSNLPGRATIMAVLISPMIVPVVITATGAYFFLARIGLVKSYTGVIVTHAMLGIPFVIITVTATLQGFDRNLIRAAESLGAKWYTTFFKVVMPLIIPGMVSGALFAFVTSFDEVVAVLFIADIEQRTIPRQMWSASASRSRRRSSPWRPS